ncbi:MAG TPA: hypothetical protein VFA98_00410 [Thermoanaerobaculia bacterium]|nr:hypothetical protein [Thermoanaerobaculia bacterium]
MRPPGPHGRLAVTALAGLAAFGLLFSIGHALGIWPGPPLGGFAGTDLVAGIVFSVVLLVVLWRDRA